MGYRLGAIDLLTNVLIVLVVVAAARAVGTLLTVALLIIPAATAKLVCRSVGAMYVVACSVGALGAWLRLAASYEASINHDLRLVSGATIVLAISSIFAAVLIGRGVVRLVRRAPTIAVASEAPA